MDSKMIRYQNTRLLVEQVGGVSNFADKIGKGQSQTSQFAGSTPIKGIGNKVAREIEKAFDKPHGWLDLPQTNYLINSNKEESINFKHSNLLDLFQKIDKLRNEEILSFNDIEDIDIIFNNAIRTINEIIDKRITN